MCGIFGYITRDGGGPKLAHLRRIAKETEQRGRHAFGLAWMDSTGKLLAYKRQGSASDHLSDLDRCAGARIVIGHCRYATHGTPRNNHNNHPHSSGSGFIVHNGIISNHATLAREHKLALKTQCDSEVFAQLVAKSGGSLDKRFAHAAGLCRGNLAVLGLWPDRLAIAKRGNPLSFGMTDGGFYFASLPGALPGSVQMVHDETVSILSLHEDGLRLDGRRIES